MTEKINIRTIYVNTAEASSVQWDGKSQPYDDQLNNTNSEIKNQIANKCSQLKVRQDPTYHMYENNDQSVHDVVQEMEINHLESKLPIILSSAKTSNRQFKIGIGILAASCCILVVALIYVTVIPSARSPCESRGCLNNGICKVVDGNIECKCLQGFGGSSCEVTPCDFKICEYGGECYLNDFRPKCSCRLGFGGENCTVTPCSGNPCHHTGECTLELNSSDYLCSCPAGFAGANCQETPCSSNPCHNNGECSYTPSSNQYNCTCQRGFSGKNCQGNPCENGLFTCEHGGECYLLNLKPKCACLNGFSGENCSSTPCSIDPCLNNGKCAYSINSSQPVCECADGYSDSYCQVTPCSYVDCENNGTCIINGNISVCECTSGFKGELCEITPCTDSPCQNHGMCAVTGSHYTCSCLGWFSGINCTDYVCDFETNDEQACIFYQQILNTINWNRVSTGNAASYGPSGAADGMFYNLLQGSLAQTRIVERLVSWTIISNSPKCLTFKSHLYGTNLRVYLDKRLNYSFYSSIIMSAWMDTLIHVPNGTKQITFEALIGGNSLSFPYVSIDSVKISDC